MTLVASPPSGTVLVFRVLTRCYTRVNDSAHRIEYILSKAALCIRTILFWVLFFNLYTRRTRINFVPPHTSVPTCGVCHAKLVWRVYYLWLFSSILFSIVIPPSRPANGGNDCVTRGGGNIVLRRGRKNIAPVNSIGRRSRGAGYQRLIPYYYYSVFISQLNNLSVYFSATPARLQSSADVTE